MKFLDLFAGIGGFRIGMESAGHECIGFCEIDKFARASYKAIHDTKGEIELHDITTVSERPYRTFSEVEQPASLFVFRIDKQANMALFEADGKRWVADAVGNVAAYLKEQLADQKHITVLA